MRGCWIFHSLLPEMYLYQNHLRNYFVFVFPFSIRAEDRISVSFVPHWVVRLFDPRGTVLLPEATSREHMNHLPLRLWTWLRLNVNVGDTAARHSFPVAQLLKFYWLTPHINVGNLAEVSRLVQRIVWVYFSAGFQIYIYISRALPTSWFSNRYLHSFLHILNCQQHRHSLMATSPSATTSLTTMSSSLTSGSVSAIGVRTNIARWYFGEL
jgi:hypothetical protein